VRDFLNQPNALGKWLHYLQTYPLDKFTEHTKPPLTGAKTNLIQLNWKPADRFAHEWMDGFMDLPFHPCSAEQLYRAFRRWCDRQGERFPPPQAQFTSQVERFGRESVQRDANGKLPPPRLIYKQIQLVRRSPDGHEQTATVRKTTRCWLPVGTGPRDGQPLGEWMAGVIDDFETPLSAFSRTPGRPEDAAAAA
jgi:putative DNA primase/helicase